MTVVAKDPARANLIARIGGKGMQRYGVAPATDVEDAAKGFEQHSDQERMLEDSLYKLMQLHWDVLTSVAFRKH